MAEFEKIHGFRYVKEFGNDVVRRIKLTPSSESNRNDYCEQINLVVSRHSIGQFGPIDAVWKILNLYEEFCDGLYCPE